MKLDPRLPIISLLPGSRRKEVERILPPMLEAAALISARHPAVQFVVVVAPGRSSNEIRDLVREQRAMPEPLPSCLHIVSGQSREALAASDAAAIASGTATLEAALLGTPMVVVYKESLINWHTLGRLITVDHYGLVNLVAGERVATELMQDESEWRAAGKMSCCCYWTRKQTRTCASVYAKWRISLAKAAPRKEPLNLSLMFFANRNELLWLS